MEVDHCAVIGRTLARRQALQAPITDELRDVVTGIVYSATAHLVAGMGELGRADGTVGHFASKLHHALERLETCKEVLLREAASALPHPDLAIYGVGSASDDDDEQAVEALTGGAT